MSQKNFEQIKILWVTLKMGSILWVMFEKYVQIFESRSKVGKILSLKKRSTSLRHLQEKSSILCVNIFKNWNIWVIVKVQFFESYWKKVHEKGPILWVIFPKKKINSLSHTQKGFNSLSHVFQKGSIYSRHIFWKSKKFFKSH